jgi:benzil reductase ((S)-benzoin forming)
VGGRLGTLDPAAVVDALNVNLVAPFLLTDAFIAAYDDLDADKLVLNVSSGAGRMPMPGAARCRPPSRRSTC